MFGLELRIRRPIPADDGHARAIYDGGVTRLSRSVTFRFPDNRSPTSKHYCAVSRSKLHYLLMRKY